MLTYQDQYELAQQLTTDYDTARLVMFKRDINEGGATFANRLGRKFNKKFYITNKVAEKQYYQLPMNVIRISKVRVLHGRIWYVPTLITSEREWDVKNSFEVKGNYPTHYYIRGNNEVGLWPIPLSTVEDALEVSVEPQHTEMTQADFTTGTVTVTNGATSITHSATGFTPQMVGRWLQVTDGTDGNWYKVVSYNSPSSVSIENYYQGISGSGRAFRIGEVMDLPQGYHDAPVFYALELYYLSKQSKGDAEDYKQRFDRKVKSARETYGRSTSDYSTRSRGSRRRASWIDLTPPVIYP